MSKRLPTSAGKLEDLHDYYSCSFAFLSSWIWYFLVFLKARELLSENLTGWQDKCGDATNVPDSVMSMIEGLRTPVANTPQASPALQRHSRVRTPTPTLHTALIHEYRGPVVLWIHTCIFRYLYRPTQMQWFRHLHCRLRRVPWPTCSIKSPPDQRESLVSITLHIT